MTEQPTPRTEAGREYVGPSTMGQDFESTQGYYNRLKATLAIEAEMLARTEALTSHPDDGHDHHFTCVRCGVDPTRTEALDVEALAFARHQTWPDCIPFVPWRECGAVNHQRDAEQLVAILTAKETP